MKILIIDDEYTIRHGIATVIRKYNERWTIVGEASDVSQALSIICLLYTSDAADE